MHTPINYTPIIMFSFLRHTHLPVTGFAKRQFQGVLRTPWEVKWFHSAPATTITCRALCVFLEKRRMNWCVTGKRNPHTLWFIGALPSVSSSFSSCSCVSLSRHGKYYLIEVKSPDTGKTHSPLTIRHQLEQILIMAGSKQTKN